MKTFDKLNVSTRTGSDITARERPALQRQPSHISWSDYTSTSPGGPGLQLLSLQVGLGNYSVQKLLGFSNSNPEGGSARIQTALIVGAADDPLEAEADQVAAHVMQIPDGGVPGELGAPAIQRVSNHPDREERSLAESADTWAQRLAGAEGSFDASDAVTARVTSLRGAGAPLDEGARTFMESRFGADFASVRVHTGNEAEHLNRSLSAQAFTIGSDIFFGANRYAPESQEGRRLLAHELTHVVQQGSAGVFSGQRLIQRSWTQEQAEITFKSVYDSAVKNLKFDHDRAMQRALEVLKEQGVDTTKFVVPDAYQKKLEQNQQSPAQSESKAPSTPSSTGVMLPTNLLSRVGTVGYYLEREKDFVSRHPELAPPDYYRNYGNKYAHRFTEVLRPKLSSVGQAWVDSTFRLLQLAIENRRAADPSAFDVMEQSSESFREFAYATHPDAYVDAGLATLPAGDLWHIVSTPDLGDLMTIPGVKQVIITGARVGGQWAEEAGEEVKDAAGEAWEWAKDLF